MQRLTDMEPPKTQLGTVPSRTGAVKSHVRQAGRGFLTAKGFDPSEAAKLDVWLTYLYLRYASDLSSGVSDLSRAE